MLLDDDEIQAKKDAMHNEEPRTGGPESAGESSRHFRPRLTSLIAAGLLAGIACGLFFGEYCAPLKRVGDVFVGLLQMSVLPYVAVSLIANLGRLSSHQSRRLALVGTAVLGGLWIIGLLIVFVLPMSFPEWQAGSFFSVLMTEPPKKIDFVEMFVPSNVFNALSVNQVPAVVVFCICVGLAVGTLKGREQLVAQLDILAKALIKVSAFIVRFAPIGVFAIAASVSGTMSLAEFARLKAYFAAYTVGAGMLALVILPLVITSCTPFTYRDVMSVSKEALLTAFATGKLIVVLPILISKTEELFARFRTEEDSEEVAGIDALYPLAYPFPHLGRLLALLFIPFAAWFSGNAMQAWEYPGFLLSGLFAYFGGPLLATPFLLDQMRLPHDMFQLFLASGVYCERLSDAVGAMHLVAFTTITTCILTGSFRLNLWRLVRMLLFSGGALLVLSSLLRIAVSGSLETEADRERAIANLQLLEKPVANVVIPEAAPNPDPLRPGETLLQRIRRRGKIRVGYNEDMLPFAYFNLRGDLVGFDISMAHELARDLGVTIEFVRFDRVQLVEQLQNDDFDVVMSGLVGTLERAEKLEHTEPYMDVTLSLVVQDYRVREFSSYELLRQVEELRIGAVRFSNGFSERLKLALPNAELVGLTTNREFFQEAHRELDALLISAESGSAYTLLYPRFEVVVPGDARVSLPLFYAIGARDTEMRTFLEHWVLLRKRDGTMQQNYDHWILGKSTGARQPRWSIIRDVLGWIK